jgi:hypothetical protein
MGVVGKFLGSVNIRISESGRRKLAKAKEWTRRYGPAEIIGSVLAVAGAFVAPEITRNLMGISSQYGWVKDVAVAYGGMIGENIGFYGTIITLELRSDRRQLIEQGSLYGLRAAALTAWNLLLEFGPAEILDSLVIRPLAMGVGAGLLGQGPGVIAGKIVADFAFYIPSIVSYELRKRRPPNA